METGRGAAVQLAYDGVSRWLEYGRWRANDRLLGERALATELGVSRASVRLALEALAGEGRLARSPQRGWFVPRLVAGEPASTLQSFTEMAASRGARATATVASSAVIPATATIAATLRLEVGAPVLRLVRVRGLDDLPIAVETVSVALPLAQPLVDVDFTDRSLYDLLESRTGVRLQRSSYTVTARGADAETAELLGLAVGEPVLVGDEVAYSDPHGDDVVLVGRIIYRADSYRFKADLFRAHR